ncbi:MAG TPA: MASE1 domain-containing protein [Thermoanaerobaculia bacterium]
MKRGTAAYIAKASLLAAVYVLLARFGLKIHAISSFATLVWPPSGISLAAILLLGYRFWPSIALGAVVANLWTGAPVAVALGIGAGNALEALFGAYALRRIPGFRSSLDRLQDVLGLVFLAAVVSSMVSATIGVSSLILGGVIAPDRFAVTWRAWWLGDAIGDLIVAPLILTWRSAAGGGLRRLRFVESGVLSLLLALSSFWIFEKGHGIAALLSPLLVWAAIRFEQRGAARAMFLVSVIAVWAATRAHGPFPAATVEEGLFLLQVFMAITAATFLVLGAVTSERRLAMEEAEAASRAKDQFLAALSHELRTPLTPVLAFSSSLERNPELPTEARRQIEIVRRNAELEARLIDDLLDLTRIARGKLRLEPRPVEVAEALDHVVEICREEAAAKGVTLEGEIAAPGMRVRADPARLRQILWNVVKNAIKFTPAGGRILLRTLVPAPGRISVEVSDTGAGIDRSDIGRIFQPFQQTRPQTGGLGLGLAISSALVEAHGGTLTAVSEGPGRGATFRIELDEAMDAEPSAQPARSVGLPPTAAGLRRVLLIEDHADTLVAARELLGELSCDVVSVGSVQEALAAAKTQSFDVVLSDLGLPDGSGLDLMRLLRDRYGLAGIAVTGYGMEDDLQRSREAGFVDHLVKPITFQQLAGVIERFFEARA